MTVEADSRGARVLRDNKYGVLATQDPEGPWAAAIAYTVVASGELFFASQTGSRHARAIEIQPQVAFCIYDSTAPTSEVESLQMDGTCHRVTDRSGIKEILAAAGEQPTEDTINSYLLPNGLGAYILRLQRGYVLDQEAWKRDGVDSREAVDLAAVFDRG